jgi:hypothetical protein
VPRGSQRGRRRRRGTRSRGRCARSCAGSAGPSSRSSSPSLAASPARYGPDPRQERFVRVSRSACASNRDAGGFGIWCVGAEKNLEHREAENSGQILITYCLKPGKAKNSREGTYKCVNKGTNGGQILFKAGKPLRTGTVAREWPDVAQEASGLRLRGEVHCLLVGDPGSPPPPPPPSKAATTTLATAVFLGWPPPRTPLSPLHHSSDALPPHLFIYLLACLRNSPALPPISPALAPISPALAPISPALAGDWAAARMSSALEVPLGALPMGALADRCRRAPPLPRDDFRLMPMPRWRPRSPRLSRPQSPRYRPSRRVRDIRRGPARGPCVQVSASRSCSRAPPAPPSAPSSPGPARPEHFPFLRPRAIRRVTRRGRAGSAAARGRPLRG